MTAAASPRVGDRIALVLVAQVNRGLLPALDYARRIGSDCHAVHVAVSSHWWERLLHHNAAMLIRWAVLPLRGVVVVEVPYALEESSERQD